MLLWSSSLGLYKFRILLILSGRIFTVSSLIIYQFYLFSPSSLMLYKYYLCEINMLLTFITSFITNHLALAKQTTNLKYFGGSIKKLLFNLHATSLKEKGLGSSLLEKRYPNYIIGIFSKTSISLYYITSHHAVIN